MRADPYAAEIEKVSDEILQMTLEKDPNDLDVIADILALQFKQEQLEYQQLKFIGAEMKVVETKHRMLSETRKRSEAAENQRKNKLLPLILKRLDDMESGASAVRDRANGPVFSEDDEQD
jgi:hypothetical protein